MRVRSIPHITASVVAALLVVSGPVHAQGDSITIRVGRLLDGRGGVREDVDIVVRGNRIAAIRLVSGTADFDLSDLTVMPGGIDTHVHISWHFDADGRTHHLGPEEEGGAQAALYTAENAYATLLGGVTTVQSLGARIDLPVRDWIAEGRIPGARLLTSSRALTERMGTPAEMRAAVRTLAASGVDVIKLFASASIRVGGTPTLSQSQLDAACGEARALGLRTAVHAHGPESARRAVLAGCTTVEHGALLDRATLDLMAEHGTYYDPHIGLIFRNYFENRDRFIGIGNYTAEGFAQMERAVPRALEVFQWALERPSLQIVFGTDAVAGSHGRNFEELIYRVETGGQDPMDAIISATSRAARSLGLEDDIGSVMVGLQADLIGLDGDPVQDITALRRVRFVMRNGTVYKTDAR